MRAYMMAMSGQLIVALARQLRNEALSLSEYAALHLLRRSGQVRISELAEGLAQPLPAMSRIVSDLVDKGLVERTEDSADRRAKTLTLTRRGASLLDEQASNLVREVGVALTGMESDIASAMMPLYREFMGREGASPKPAAKAAARKR
jgi:DNA-binding MarR family transcriptional regulator